MAKIVTIGGGKGQPELLRYLAQYPHQITAVVSVMDNGGSSGKLREMYHVLPPGDIRRCITALAPNWALADRMWNYRFPDGQFADHAMGNLFLTALSRELGSLQAAIDASMKLFGSKGRVLPVTLDDAQLYAELEDGTQIVGETNIDVPKHASKAHIAKLWLGPEAYVTDDVRSALQEADVIVLTMGDVYTSVLPNLLVKGVTEAIAESGAKMVAVCNRSTKFGETHGFTTQDFCRVFEQYLAPARLDILLEDTGVLPVADGIECVAHTDLAGTAVQLLRRDIANPEKPQLVSGKKVAAVIDQLCTS